MSNEQKVRQLTTSWARGENARLSSGLPISRLKRSVRRIGDRWKPTVLRGADPRQPRRGRWRLRAGLVAL